MTTIEQDQHLPTSAKLDAATWDARAAYDVGVIISRYIAENPAPPDAKFAADIETWGENLQRWGRGYLRAAGASPLRPVGGV